MAMKISPFTMDASVTWFVTAQLRAFGRPPAARWPGALAERYGLASGSAVPLLQQLLGDQDKQR